MKPAAKMIEKFGIMDRVPMQIAMAIGAGETTLERLITAYAMLANGGKKLEPTLIDRIQDRHGKTIFLADTRVCPNCATQPWFNQSPPVIQDHREQLADPRSIYQITSMLEGAVREGSARKAQVLGKIVAMKTGTSNEERDAWTAAYTQDLVVVAHVGHDKPQTLGHMRGGSRVALPVVVAFLQEALKDVPSKPFKIPPDMKLVRMGNNYEALKNNQSVPKRAASESRPANYDYPSSEHSYSPSYERQYDNPSHATPYSRQSEGALPPPIVLPGAGTGGLY
jgi:penicillin-binding protein 1A